MSFNVSSSDDEQESTTVLKYKCPAEFVPFSYHPSKSVSLDSEEPNELWLIKAPAHFDPKCFAKLKFSLSGLQMVQSHKTPQSYNVLSSTVVPSDLHLLIADEKNKSPSLCSSDFTGVLNISESSGNCSENQSLIPIPTTPAPSIPPGLKQRFQPFGSSVPAHVEVTMVSPTPPRGTSLDPDVSEERRKKKKKKKDRREVHEDVSIKQEQMQVEVDYVQIPDCLEDVRSEERRKKKKKKEKERSEVDVSLITETEPQDSSLVDAETTRKSKKKKKSHSE